MEETRTEAASNNRRKKIAVAGFIVLLIAGIVSVFLYLQYKATHISTDDAFVEGRIHSVAPKISGTVMSVHVEDNQIVRKGDLLVEIDPADYDAKLQEASAAFEVERSKLAEVEARIKSAKAEVALEEATFRQAALDLRRMEKLYGDGAISKERHEKTQTSYDVALARKNAAVESLAEARASLASQSSAAAQKASKRKTEELNLGYTRVSAPSDGMVTRKSVERGNHVQPGQPLMAVVALDDLWLVANYKETQLKKIKPGQKVEIEIDTYPGETLTGKVDSIMAGTGAAFSLFPPQNATGNYVKVVQRVPVKIVLDKDGKPDRPLRVGMSAVPTIIIEASGK